MRKKSFLGLQIKQIIGMLLCVAISVSVLCFGTHDVNIEDKSVLRVEAQYEAQDGDLDFGEGLADGDKIAENIPDGTENNELSVTPSITPGVTDKNPGTEEEPLILEDEQFRYNVVEGVATVSEVLCAELEEAVIPQSIGGYPVEIIGEYLFQNYSPLKRLKIPEGIKEIRWNAFENCTALEAVQFPASLHTICECAFWNTGLTTVHIPDTVRVLEDYAFFSCEKLTSLSLATTANLADVFDMALVEEITLAEGVSVIEEEAFGGAEALRKVTLPSTLTMIKPYAFWECTSLETLEIPDGVASIGANAFENCYALQEVKMPAGLLLLSEYAFYSCWSLEQLELPAGITTIQDSAFEDCEQLVLLVTAGSVGEEYVIENDLLYEVQ